MTGAVAGAHGLRRASPRLLPTSSAASRTSPVSSMRLSASKREMPASVMLMPKRSIKAVSNSLTFRRVSNLPTLLILSDIYVVRIERVALDAGPPRFDIVAHQGGEDFGAGDRVFPLHAQQAAHLRVHSGFPQLFRIHLAKASCIQRYIIAHQTCVNRGFGATSTVANRKLQTKFTMPIRF